MTALIREMANRYMDAKCQTKAWHAVKGLADEGLISSEEWLWFVNVCGAMVYDYEELRVYVINDDGSMNLAKRFQ
jgi:hypothetical protein